MIAVIVIIIIMLAGSVAYIQREEITKALKGTESKKPETAAKIPTSSKLSTVAKKCYLKSDNTEQGVAPSDDNCSEFIVNCKDDKCYSALRPKTSTPVAGTTSAIAPATSTPATSTDIYWNCYLSGVRKDNWNDDNKGGGLKNNTESEAVVKCNSWISDCGNSAGGCKAYKVGTTPTAIVPIVASTTAAITPTASTLTAATPTAGTTAGVPSVTRFYVEGYPRFRRWNIDAEFQIPEGGGMPYIAVAGTDDTHSDPW